MEPKIVKKDKIFVAGLAFFGSPEEGKFGQTWDRFFKVENQITNHLDPHIYYGVELYPPGGPVDRQWTYLAGIQVPNLDDLPPGILGVALPASTYAVFTAKGSLENIPKVFGFAYHEWLPRSEYVALEFDFELYDERFNMANPETSEVDLYIPVRSQPS